MIINLKTKSMENPIQVLVREIKDEAENACEIYSHLLRTPQSQKSKRITNDNYVMSVRRISELVHAIEKLNS